MNTNNVINNILGVKPKCDRRSKNNSYEFKCPSCGLKYTVKEAMNMGYTHCGRQMKRLGHSTVVKNNTRINEDVFGNCYFCGEKHKGKPCPDSESVTEDN